MRRGRRHACKSRKYQGFKEAFPTEILDKQSHDQSYHSEFIEAPVYQARPSGDCLGATVACVDDRSLFRHVQRNCRTRAEGHVVVKIDNYDKDGGNMSAIAFLLM